LNRQREEWDIHIPPVIILQGDGDWQTIQKGRPSMVGEKKLSKKMPAEPELKQLISDRAYEIYLDRGNRDGDPFSDWLQAEREILGRYQSVTKSRKPPSPVLKANVTLRKKAVSPELTASAVEKKLQGRKTVSHTILDIKPAGIKEKKESGQSCKSPKPMGRPKALPRRGY
jgi:hypothetical protein